MSGIYAGWRRGGGIAQVLAESARHRSGRVVGPVVRGEAGVVVCAQNGRQTLYDDERVIVACEAELYQTAELRESAPDAESDAALVAALYLRFGRSFVERLRGRFAITIWDRREREMVAAVDAFGIGRLVYYADDDTLLVGSRLDALAASGAVDLRVNPRAIVNLLNFSANLAPDTILSAVTRLQPGKILIANERGLRVMSYWDMRYGRVDVTDEDELARQLEATVEGAVAAVSQGCDRKRVGAFLSGGTDSSTVLGMLRRLGNPSPQAFSIGFEDQEFNELEYAAIAARKFTARHRTRLVGADDCFASMQNVFGAFDEPFGNSSAVPTYFCALLAKENGVEIMLAGDGGDELFGGNERYATDKIFQTYHSIPGVARKGLIEPLLAILPGQRGPLGRAKRYVWRANLPPMQRFMSFQFLSVCPPEMIFDGGMIDALAGYSILDVPTRYYNTAPASDHLDRLLYFDVKMTLGDSDLPKVTAMCDLAGVTPRYPFLDREVAELSGRIPSGLKVKGFEKRYLFKKAFANLLPQEIIKKRKHGFGIPVSTWLKTDRRFQELARDTLLSRRAAERGYFRSGLMEELFRRHAADPSPFYGDTLWTFLALELWHLRVVDVKARAAV